MTSFQSTLGEEEGIAEELAAGQREISIAEFFEKNKHMLGFDSGARGLVTAVKEAVDNALDACEEARIQPGPDIYVEIKEVGDYYRLVVEDNGPGITKEQLPRVFGKLLYGSRFHAREQSRGQQGIGISAAVLFSQLTSGKPAKITSRTQGASEANYYELIIDTDSNEPEIKTERETSWDRSHGTRIELEMEANMRARAQLHDYIKHTAVVNPHARLELREPALDEPLKFERVEGASLPAETEEIRPHPHGVELGTLIKMLEATESYSVSGFLQGEFTRVGKKTADKVVNGFRDRHFGREMSWPAPEGVDLEAALTDAVSGKGAKATSIFASEIADVLDSRDLTAHHELVGIVDNVADATEEETGKTFGDTVRENAVEAAWTKMTTGRVGGPGADA
ncbi:DNA topoisomerase VI subunit B, partial [Halobium palmae]